MKYAIKADIVLIMSVVKIKDRKPYMFSLGFQSENKMLVNELLVKKGREL